MNHQTNTKIHDPLTVRGRIQHYCNLELKEFPMRKINEQESDYEKRKQRTFGAIRGNVAKVIKETIKSYKDETKVDLSDRVDLYRRLVFSWLLTPDDDIFQDRSTSEYKPADWFAISKWQGSHKDPITDEWKLRDAFHDEVLLVLRCAKEDWADVQKGNNACFNDIQLNWNKVLQDEKKSENKNVFVPEPMVHNEPLPKFQARCEVVLAEEEPFPFVQSTLELNNRYFLPVI